MIALLAIPVSQVNSNADQHTKIPYYMYNAANAFNIDVALLYALCKVESNCTARAMNRYDSNQDQRSKGIVDKSYGLFQLKVATAKGLGFKDSEVISVTIKRHNKTLSIKKTISHVEDLLKPEINTWYAAKLLRHLYNQYNDTNKVISAYNAGRYIRANKDYVCKVLSKYAMYKIDRRL
jgi:soluble lytic murein transglycosylase-like protein